MSATNGHPAASALTQGGYDAYFAQVEQSGDETADATVAGTEAAAGQDRSTAGPAAAVAPPQDSASAPQTAGGSSLDLGRTEAPAPPPVPGQTVPQAEAGPGVDPGRSRVPQPSGETPPAAPGPGIPGSPVVGAVPTAAAPGGPAATGAAPPPADSSEQWQGAPAMGAGHTYASPRSHAETQGGQEQVAPQGYRTHGAPAGANNNSAHVLERISRSGYDNRSAVLPPTLASPELLADIAAVRQAHLRSNAGVRGALNKVGFSFGLSPAEQRAEDRRNRVRRALTTPYQIAVVSVKGGVGRTTTTAALGSTFAKMRPDRVAAVDANPDFGDLSTRTVRHPYGLTLRDLATASHALDSFSSVHAYTAVNAADLAVVASPWNSDATAALSGTEYGIAVETLRKHYNLLLVDCGTGVLDSATDMVLRSSDAVLVVTPATVGGVTGAVATLNWLSSHGFDHLIAASMVAIVHHQPVKPTVDVEAIEKLFASAQRPTCRIPFDTHLAEGGEVDLRMLEKETALAFEELAAGLADDFPGYEVGPAGAGGRL
ncbi:MULTISPECIES: AAA family ATPase [Nocardia]|uniref:AAA family ATPase n=1 Tax=Nocardia TaxID=1817 RepID=UPI002453DF78|nr:MULTISPECIES: AAA family ATPase [Nocardia]